MSQVSHRSQETVAKKDNQVAAKQNREIFKQPNKIANLAQNKDQIVVKDLKKEEISDGNNPFSFMPKPRLLVVPTTNKNKKKKNVDLSGAKDDLAKLDQNALQSESPVGYSPIHLGSPYSSNMAAANIESQEGPPLITNRFINNTHDHDSSEHIKHGKCMERQSPLKADQAVLESIPERRSLSESISKLDAWQQLLYSFMPTCMKPRNINRVLVSTEKHIEHKLDLIKILEVILKVEKLLKLMLTTDQLLLFNLLPWDFDTSDRIVETRDDKIDMLKDAQITVRKLQNQESLTLLDAKLLQVLGFLSDVEFS